jgi:putative ABC transport system permease protein
MLEISTRLRQMFRSLANSPRFAVLSILTLAIGIGGNLAVFAALEQIFFRPLPLEDADRLVRIEDFTISTDGRRMKTAVLDTHLVEIVARARGFAGFAAESDQSMTLLDAGHATRVNVLRATPGSWTTLGVRPVLGRLFSPEEERIGADAGVLVLTHALWRERFGGRPDIIGTIVHLDDREYQIVGVLAAGFRFPWEADAWIPERVMPDGRRDYAVFARLGGGVSVAAASSDMARVALEIKTAHPETSPGYGLEVEPLRESLIEGRQRVAIALSVLVLLFLSIACANVTNLQMARVVTRRGELAVRAALGASTAARVGLVLSESLILAIAGTAVGLIVALSLATYFSVLIPSNLVRELGLGNDGLDWPLSGFAVLVCAASGLIAGAIPALVSRRINAELVLRGAGRSIASVNRRLLGAFVIAQLALATMLLGATAIVVRDFEGLVHATLGVDADRVIAAAVTLPAGRYTTDVSRDVVARRLIARLAEVPGVDSAALTTINPFAGGRWRAQIEVDGRPTPVDGAYNVVNHRLISPTLFRTMHIPVVAGRVFSDSDATTGEPVAIVSARLARHLWPTESPVGKRLRHVRPGAPWRTVVGVVGDVADAGDMKETWYVPYAQQAGVAFADSFYLVAHVQVRPEALLPGLEPAVQSVDPTLPVYNVGVLSDQFQQSVLPNKLGVIVVAALSGFGLLLALVGTYSVTSYIAADNGLETAVRLALGASTRDIVSLEVRRTVKLALIGVAVGIAGSVMTEAAVRAVLVLPGGRDLWVTGGTALVLFSIALTAGVFPAWKASRVPVAVALRRN